ncbi:MAG: molybdate ABC transporter permease subunit [Acidobacteriota bacterium]
MLHPDELSALRVSLQVAGTAAVLALPFAVGTGYWLARTRSRARVLVETLVNLPLVLPPVVTGYLLLVLLGRSGPLGSWLHERLGLSLVFTWGGAVIAAMVVSFPLMVRAIRLAFEGLDPRLELAARSLGASRLSAFFTVSLPLARPGLLAGALLAFARSLGEFGATIMIAGNIEGRTRTLPLAIYSLAHRPGGLESCWRMVLLSIACAAGALLVSEWLARRHEARP